MTVVSRVQPSNLGSCPRCRRLVMVFQLATHAVGWPPVHRGPIPPGRATLTTVLVWDVPKRYREDYGRLVGSRAVDEQGYGTLDRLPHECDLDVTGIMTGRIA